MKLLLGPIYLLETVTTVFIVIGFLIALILIALFIFLCLKKPWRRKKEAIPPKTFIKSEYIDALGGEDNIIEHHLAGSRIILKLKNYDLVNQDKLRTIGVDAFIMMSDKLTLVFKAQAQEGYKKIFGE